MFSCLTPLVRVSTLGDQRVLVNLANGRWLRVNEEVYSALNAESVSAIIANLCLLNVSEQDSQEFIGVLSEHGFLRQEGVEYPLTLSFKPTNAYLNVTNSCNLVCPGCYFSASPKLSHGVDTQSMLLLIDRLFDAGIRHLVVSGGEALSRPDIDQLLLYAKAKSFDEIILLTNGTLMSEALAEVVAECVDLVSISIDGPDEAINAKMRGKGNFEPAIKGIQTLQATGYKKIQVVMTVSKHNIETVAGIRALAHDLGVKLGFSIFADVGRGKKRNSLRPDLGQLERLYEEERVIAGSDASSSDSRVLDIVAGVTCGSGTLMVSLDCFGNVYPCHLMHQPGLMIGNLLEQPDLLVMLSESAVAKRIRAHTVEERKCHGCPVEYFCKGGCLAHTAVANASAADPLSEIDPYCALHRTILTEQIWV